MKTAQIIALALPAGLLWGSAAAACPASFPAFLSQFESDPAFQRQHTRFPLAASRIDNQSGDEPFEVKYTIQDAKRKEYQRVAWPTRARQQAAGLQRSIAREAGGGQAVTFSQPGTDYMFTFHFQKTRDCWTLVRFADHSL
ncbi:hypothetical protein [Pseudoduganella sp.]|uniref:hypothetical protein n=1 Tax=Pseudoduganella sp. TaxID=1880898 RepID=UPI0035B453A3